MTNILIIGAKNWNRVDTIKYSIFMHQPKDVHIYTLMEPGASLIARQIALENGYGQTDIPELNDEVWNKINLVLAYHPFIRNSKNTLNIYNEAAKRNIKRQIFNA